MEYFNYAFRFIRMAKRVLKINDSIVVSLLSGLLGTLVMGASSLLFWRVRKTEALYGHISGSILMRPFRLNQRKNFWLGQITHLLTGATLAYPLNFILKKTGKDYHLLKGAFFGAVTWEVLYGLGQRFNVFSTKSHFTKTHYAELFNHLLYGVVTSQALVSFSESSMFPDTQGRATAQETKIDAEFIAANKDKVQPIYPDVYPDDLEIMQ